MALLTALHTAPQRSASVTGSPPRGLRGGVAELIRAHPFVLALAALWAFAPVLAVAGHVLVHGGMMTGTNGGDFFDQFQYLAWIRDEGTHGAASNLWSIAPSAHDYVQPMYLISGLLWRLGLSLQLAYLVWKPIALLVLFLGTAWYIRELIPERRGAQAAALLLALFYESPAYALMVWTHRGSFPTRLNVLLPSDDSTAAVQLWGFEHTAIAIGLTAAFFVCAERLLRGPATRRWIAGAATAGLWLAWLHPWQAAVVLAAVGVVLLMRPERRRLQAMVIPVGATLLPLLYGLALSHFDIVWHTFQQETTTQGTQPWWALALALGPLALPAALGLRRPTDEREWLLVLWVIATAAVYLLIPEFPPHALAGITVPLAVLAVRGFARARARLRLAPRAALVLGALAVAALVLPATVLHARDVPDDLKPGLVGSLALSELRLTDDEAAAMDYLQGAPGSGGVLAPQMLSLSVPAFTGRPVYIGHLMWEPASHVAVATAFFGAGRIGASQRRAILRATGARFVLAPCGTPAALGPELAPLARPVWRRGCVTVYATAGA
jgi:hypothetical protein